MKECPTSYLLREAPWVWDLMESAAMVEGMGPDRWANAPRALRRAARIYQGEMARIREVKAKRAKGRAASNYGVQVRSGRG